MFKKILKSLLNLILFSAILHNSILLFLSITKGDIKYLNYFRILSLDEFWPKIAESRTSDLISLMVVLLLLMVFLLWEIYKKKEKFDR